MKLEIDDGITLTLSRQNLLALLHKLDWPLSHRRLQSCNTYIDGREIDVPFAVCVEDDAIHYRDRPESAGATHPLTEEFIDHYGADADGDDD